MRSSTIACAAAFLALGGAPTHAQVFHSAAGDIAVETVAKGLDHPWALAFLPDGRMLVTERPGRLRIVVQGRQAFAAARRRAEGLRVRPGRPARRDRSTATSAQNQTIYFCYAEPASGGARTALARARLVDDGTPRLDDVKVIFRQDGPLSSGNHFGCRIVQTPDDNLFLTTGRPFHRTRPGAEPRQSPRQDRAHPAGRRRCRRTIRSSAERAPSRRSGATATATRRASRSIPHTGKLWEHEHGPRGGDEINIIEKGKNYGWPVIGYGIDYSGAKIHESTRKAGMEQPIHYWVPSIAPSGMAFYTGDLFPAWRGNLFVGALAGQLLVRLELDGEKVVKEERLLRDLRERIRDVRQGPDGALWLLTDSASGRILRLAPAK